MSSISTNNFRGSTFLVHWGLVKGRNVVHFALTAEISPHPQRLGASGFLNADPLMLNVTNSAAFSQETDLVSAKRRHD